VLLQSAETGGFLFGPGPNQQVKEDGSFHLGQVGPDRYWEEAEYGAWMDPDFLKPQESRGEAVSIQEGGRQAIQVNVIPADSQ
jgi:hypothetical protein